MLQKIDLKDAKIEKLCDQRKYREFDMQGIVVKHTVTKKHPVKRRRCTVIWRDLDGMEHVMAVENFSAQLKWRLSFEEAIEGGCEIESPGSNRRA